jgi:hypothetical protein
VNHLLTAENHQKLVNRQHLAESPLIVKRPNHQQLAVVHNLLQKHQPLLVLQ